MSVFNSDKNRRKPVAVETLVGRGTEILGDVLFSGGLHVDGSIKGKVLASSGDTATLSISETGSIEGDISVPILVVNGRVSGNVYAREKMTLTANARVSGNVYYNSLELQVGAEVEGHLVYDPTGERTPAAMQPARSEIVKSAVKSSNKEEEYASFKPIASPP
ncbi:MAG: bactofilin family protein [Panacagrimonas sp.]